MNLLQLKILLIVRDFVPSVINLQKGIVFYNSTWRVLTEGLLLVLKNCYWLNYKGVNGRVCNIRFITESKCSNELVGGGLYDTT